MRISCKILTCHLFLNFKIFLGKIVFILYVNFIMKVPTSEGLILGLPFIIKYDWDTWIEAKVILCLLHIELKIRGYLAFTMGGLRR